MDHSEPASTEITFAKHGATGTKHIWKVFWILLGITAVELGLGLAIYALLENADTAKLLVKGLIVILSLAKAFYIVSYFMHLGDEIRNMIMTIVVPLFLFVWFIIAFLNDGNNWRNARNTNAGSIEYQKQISQPADAVQPGHEK